MTPGKRRPDDLLDCVWCGVSMTPGMAFGQPDRPLCFPCYDSYSEERAERLKWLEGRTPRERERTRRRPLNAQL